MRPRPKKPDAQSTPSSAEAVGATPPDIEADPASAEVNRTIGGGGSGDEGGAAEAAAEATEAAAEGATAVTESPEEAVRRLEEEVASWRERHLRTAAEYDNFRKRTARERDELWARAQAGVVGNILDALDDFGRALDVDGKSVSAADLLEGMQLVERKLVKELERAGLEKVGEVGEPFDPNHHEAVASLPAAGEDQDHTVGAVLQVGYRFGGALLRPAKVQVLMWHGPAAGAGDDGA